MIVDSSVLVAIVLREAGWEALVDKLSAGRAGAVASLAGQPLLYVGEDFARTDLPRA